MSDICNSCGEWFDDYTELARHIAGAKTGHKKGKKWAAKYLLRVNQLNSKKEYEDKIPLSEEDKQNRRELMNIQLSGQKKMVNTMCPHCKKELTEVHYQEIKQDLGKRCMYFCPECKCCLGFSHRKGLTVGW